MRELQADGTMFAGPTFWHGRSAMRISVSSWRTTKDDVDRCVEAVLCCRELARRDPVSRGPA